MTNNKFPKITLPSAHQPPFVFTTKWDEIKSVEQLPNRLFLGGLVENSFRITNTGWTVRYEEGVFSLIVERHNAAIKAHLFFADTEVLMGSFPAKAEGSAIAKVFMNAASVFDRKLRPYYEARYNLSYVPLQSSTMVHCYPDGFFQTLLLPIPFQSHILRGLVNAIKELQSRATISYVGCLNVVQLAINYREGLCPGVPDSEKEHLEWLLNHGYMGVQLPVWEGSPGNRAFTSRPHCYLLAMNLAMRFVPEVLHCLHSNGVIQPHLCDHGEQMAFIMNTQDVVGASMDTQAADSASTVSAFSADSSRRMTIPLNWDGVPFAADFQSDATIEAFAAAIGHAQAAFDESAQRMLSRLSQIYLTTMT